MYVANGAKGRRTVWGSGLLMGVDDEVGYPRTVLQVRRQTARRGRVLELDRPRQREWIREVLGKRRDRNRSVPSVVVHDDEQESARGRRRLGSPLSEPRVRASFASGSRVTTDEYRTRPIRHCGKPAKGRV